MTLAQTLRGEGGLLARRGRRRTRRRDGDGPYAPVLAAIREGYEQHYGEGRVLRTDDRDLALLAGDRLYALGLALLAEQGDLRAVGVLADLISECAAAHAERRPRPRRRGLEPRDDRVARRRLSCPRRPPGDIVRRPSRSERPFVPDPRKTPKSKYTADRDYTPAPSRARR